MPDPSLVLWRGLVAALAVEGCVGLQPNSSTSSRDVSGSTGHPTFGELVLRNALKGARAEKKPDNRAGPSESGFVKCGVSEVWC